MFMISKSRFDYMLENYDYPIFKHRSYFEDLVSVWIFKGIQPNLYIAFLTKNFLRRALWGPIFYKNAKI